MPQLLSGQLPDHLTERVRTMITAPMAKRPINDRGELVLYWMHHAVRGHENPALDVALHAAAALGLPLLVYQGLAGSHQYNSDRHHSFILEGARDAHTELAARGVRAVFFLPNDPAALSPLAELAARAALLVTEDFPASPFPQWTRGFAERIAAPVWAVDSACMIPMRLQPERFERAFAFRRQNQRAYAERVLRPWPETNLAVPAYHGPLPFTPLDLAAADIQTLCAACNIDHSVPPVAHTPGGSRAGYARWEKFKRAGLPTYHQRRNDAAESWPRGVSRLSAYLHHGQVSPFRIAREARAAGGEGADKFLDELLIWRELAHNFCFFTADPECLAALPEWARQTLAAHANDPRERGIDWETLARGRTGDRLWDLAQRSLLVHGELHNNLRMTWAKAILSWTATPEAALATLVDLNHRFALDGSDPNSYGGLLWALGLFDRPFAPERPVTGSLRVRGTAEHARRLDLDRYARKVDAPAGPRRLRIAVIGAGMAGLAAARMLSDHNHRIRVFEKSRGYGGRAATRRIGDRCLGIDHGAQYFTTRDPRFRRRVLSWAERGIVSRWHAAIGSFDGSVLAPLAGDDERWVGVPGMSALARRLGEELDVTPATRVAPPRRHGDGWLLRDDQGGDLGHYDRVLISAPAPQAAVLLQAAPVLAEQARAVRLSPCWSVLLGLDPDFRLPYDGLFVNQGPLRWLARNASKPGRSGSTWILHATPDWTTAHLDDSPATVIALLLDALADIGGAAAHAGARVTPAAEFAQAHRWLYAFAADPLTSGCLWDPALGIGACGDWCCGARIEGAWLSGEALAGRVLAQRTLA